MSGLKIAIAGDHAGYQYKEMLKKVLTEKGYLVEDFGPHVEESVDYPDYVHPTVESIENKENEFGILICGSGNGVAMTANKHRLIRAALCWDVPLAALARHHNNANVLCIPSRFVSEETAVHMAEKFLSSEFEGGRHSRRVEKIIG